MPGEIREIRRIIRERIDRIETHYAELRAKKPYESEELYRKEMEHIKALKLEKELDEAAVIGEFALLV